MVDNEVIQGEVYTTVINLAASNNYCDLQLILYNCKLYVHSIKMNPYEYMPQSFLYQLALILLAIALSKYSLPYGTFINFYDIVLLL